MVVLGERADLRHERLQSLGVVLLKDSAMHFVREISRNISSGTPLNVLL